MPFCHSWQPTSGPDDILREGDRVALDYVPDGTETAVLVHGEIVLVNVCNEHPVEICRDDGKDILVGLKTMLVKTQSVTDQGRVDGK